MRNYCYSDGACMVAYEGIEVPDELKNFGKRVKGEVVTQAEALDLAEKFHLEVMPITGDKGIVGALAAVSLYDIGTEYAAFKDDPAILKVKI